MVYRIFPVGIQKTQSPVKCTHGTGKLQESHRKTSGTVSIAAFKDQIVGINITRGIYILNFRKCVNNIIHTTFHPFYAKPKISIL